MICKSSLLFSVYLWTYFRIFAYLEEKVMKVPFTFGDSTVLLEKLYHLGFQWHTCVMFGFILKALFKVHILGLQTRSISSHVHSIWIFVPNKSYVIFCRIFEFSCQKSFEFSKYDKCSILIFAPKYFWTLWDIFFFKTWLKTGLQS